MNFKISKNKEKLNIHNGRFEIVNPTYRAGQQSFGVMKEISKAFYGSEKSLFQQQKIKL